MQAKLGKNRLKELNELTSARPDAIYPMVLKELANAIIFNNSWRMSEIPEDWRRANSNYL